MTSAIRPFSGSLAEAQGILAVERATFHESPYAPDELRVMLTEGPQSAWVAMNGQEVVGFVVAFPTKALSGPCWEIDLLAVHPAWRGHGLATRLVQAATSYGSGFTRRARAVVATDNHASAATFTGAGFTAGTERHDLLIYRPRDGTNRPGHAPIRLASRPGVGELRRSGVIVRMLSSPEGSDAILLQAEVNGRAAGLAELVEVQTLLYCGFWIESLTGRSRIVREALVDYTLQRARDQGFDEAGAMVPRRDRQLREALLAAGFFSLGEYVWFTASLPLPDTSGSPSGQGVVGREDASSPASGTRVQGRDA